MFSDNITHNKESGIKAAFRNERKCKINFVYFDVFPEEELLPEVEAADGESG